MTEEQFYDCIDRIQARDKSGLKDIYNAYMPYIYTIIYGIVQNRENAEDIASDFFIRLYSNASQYKKGHGHKGYLATIARNMAIDFLRKHKREILTNDFTGSDVNGHTTPGYAYEDGQSKQINRGQETLESEVEQQVISDMRLQEALEKLNPKERVVIDMKILSEMTFHEIAQALDIPIGTIAWRYREAIKKLRRCGFDERS